MSSDDPQCNAIPLIKTKLAGYQTECDNLAQQVARSEQFLNERRSQLIHAQGKHAGLADVLKILEPAAPNEVPLET
jgi:hypothetical protein